MSQSITFNWHELDRNMLFDILYSIQERIVNQPLTVNQLHNKFVSRIKKFIPIKFKKNIDTRVESGWVLIGGCYYSDKDEDNEKAIELNFNYSSKDEIIVMTKNRFSKLCLTFADTVLHEIIHMRQHRRRGWKVLPDFPSTASRNKQRQEQQYLGCRDEIDAYSFNIACELNDKFDSKHSKISKYLNTNQKNLRKRRDLYTMYLTAFGHDHNHIVIKRLKKKVVSYLPQAIAGKPYRNSDWIGY